MKLDNRTEFPAVLVRGVLGDDMMFGSLAVRVTYDLGPELRPAAEQLWEASVRPFDSPQGEMPGDELFYRGGVDLFVFGHARAPGGRPTASMDVVCEVGDKFRHAVRVFGERRWVGRPLGAPRIGDPEPFREMPLTFDRAFGGKDEWDGLEVPFPANPEGRGFALDARSLAGRLLPNLEHPERLIAAPMDQPEPVGLGLAPLGFGPRTMRHVDFDPETGMLERLGPGYFNHAFPDMIMPSSVVPGDLLAVHGVREDGPLELVIPPCPLTAHLSFDDKVIEERPALDQVGVEADEGRAFVSYRWPFRYRMIPEQKRDLVLTGASPKKEEEACTAS